MNCVRKKSNQSFWTIWLFGIELNSFKLDYFFNENSFWLISTPFFRTVHRFQTTMESYVLAALVY